MQSKDKDLDRLDLTVATNYRSLKMELPFVENGEDVFAVLLTGYGDSKARA